MHITISGSEIAKLIRAHISENLLAEFGGDLNDETDLFDAGIIDSFGFIELIAFIEKKFNVRYEGEELVSEGLSTISRMVNSVILKLTR